MASNVIKVSVLADASQLKRALGESERATRTTGDKLTAFGKVAIAALAVTAVGAATKFATDSVREFSNLNESLNALDVTYGEHAEGIKALGEEAATSLGLSNSEFNTFAVQMSGFAETIAGESGDVAGLVDDMSTRVADFASVMNLDVAEAARVFQSSLAGETEPIRKFGIRLDAASVQAHALATGIWDGEDAMTEAEKVQGRYSLLMEETEKVAGDFADTSGELANQTRILTARMADAQAEIGGHMVPILVDLQEAALGMFDALAAPPSDTGSFMETTIGDFKEWGEAIGGVRDEIVDMWIDAGLMNEVIGDAAVESEIYLEVLRQQRGALIEIKPPLKAVADGMEEIEDDTDLATTALQRFEDEVLSQTDPLYALKDAHDDVTEALADVMAAEEEFGKDSPEYANALIDVANANDDLTAAQLLVAEQSGLTRDEFGENLRRMGNLSKEQIDIILAEFDKVNAFNFKAHTVIVNGKVVGFGMPSPTSGKAAGGPVSANTPYLVGEQGPEIMVPSSNGTIIPNNRLASAAGGTTVINLTVNSLDPAGAARLVVQALQSYERQNGAIPVKVRPA